MSVTNGNKKHDYIFCPYQHAFLLCLSGEALEAGLTELEIAIF